jgi:hypothetical protein
MTQFRVLALAIGIIVPAASACSDDNSSPSNGATSFTATLMGANEVPPVTTPATGTATLTVNGQQIEYTVNVSNITNPVLSHIHIAPVGENGPVRLNLCGTGAPLPPCTGGTGVLAAGTNGTMVGTPAITFDSLVSAMRSGGAYVNVHTSSEGCTVGDPGCNPGGEIRGQVQAAN